MPSSLPTYREYQDAIQNPKSCFSNLDLQQSKPETDKLGLPRPRSGNFAVVFPLIHGSSKWAVRCFTTYHPDQEMRYQKISEYLKKQALPYTVGFEFIKQGIKVKGSWYPILKMEWAEGESLLKYIERNLGKPAEIQSLADKFYTLVCDLKKHGIAHGDLQHGNLLVVNGGFRLVDYDGMFVPGLEGMQSNEIGHPNYQHPLRNRNHFGHYLDNFSAWCIYISLLALAADPGLWNRISAGDEHICFRRKDFENPNSSQAIQTVEKIKNDRVQELFPLFKTIIYLPDVRQIPSLDGVATPEVVSVKPSEKTESIGPDWLRDHVKKPPVEVPMPSLFERAFAKALLLLVFLSFAFLLFSNFSDLRVAVPALLIVVGFTALLVIMSVRFRELPENAKKSKLSSELKELESESKKDEGELKKLEEDKKKTEQERDKKFNDIALKQRECAQKESNEIAQIDKDLRDTMDSITSKRKSLVNEEVTELATALRSIQTQYLLGKLSLHSIGTTSVPGIGQEMIRRLHANGIRTAADIASVQIVQTRYGRHTNVTAYIEVPGRGDVHVKGIGPMKAQALWAWKQQVENEIKPSVPQSLTSEQENAIKLKYFSKRQSLDAQEADAKRRAVNEKDACKLRFRREAEDLERQLSDATKSFAKRIEDLDKQIADMRRLLADKRWKRDMVELELKSYARFTFRSYVNRAFFHW